MFFSQDLKHRLNWDHSIKNVIFSAYFCGISTSNCIDFIVCSDFEIKIFKFRKTWKNVTGKEVLFAKNLVKLERVVKCGNILFLTLHSCQESSKLFLVRKALPKSQKIEIPDPIPNLIFIKNWARDRWSPAEKWLVILISIVVSRTAIFWSIF